MLYICLHLDSWTLVSSGSCKLALNSLRGLIEDEICILPTSIRLLFPIHLVLQEHRTFVGLDENLIAR